MSAPPLGRSESLLLSSGVRAISKAGRRIAEKNPSAAFPSAAERIKNRIERGLSGRQGGFSAVPLFERGTPFQRAVWRELQKIPRGETRSYGDIARKIGRPKAARAVGGACAANPFLIAVPCHRAIAKGGGPGGFALGLKAKRILLGAEKPPPAKN